MQNLITYWTTSIEGTALLKNITFIAEENNFNTAKITLLIKKKFENIHAQILNLAIEIVCARQKALYLGDWVKEGIILAEPLIQCSHPAISKYRAEKFSGCSIIHEICTGLGIDAYYLAKTANQVITFETNPEFAEIAKYNFSIQGITNIKVVNQDPIKDNLLNNIEALFSDPSRKQKDGTKVRDPKDGSPGLDDLLKINAEKLCVKLSPAWSPNGDYAGQSYEWVGEKDECKELLLWKGFSNSRTASIPGINYSKSYKELSSIVFQEEFTSQQYKNKYITVPHSILIASSLVFNIFQENKVLCFNKQGLWGIADNILEDACIKNYKIIDVLKSSEKEIQKFLSENSGAHSITVSKLGEVKSFDKICKLIMKFKSKEKIYVFAVSHLQKEYVIICADV